MLRVRILGEDNELPRIIGPVTQEMEVEQTPRGGLLRRRIDPCEGIAIAHAPPTLHVELHLTLQVRGGT